MIDAVINRRIAEYEMENLFYRKKAFTCDQCEVPMYVGDTYHHLFGRMLCPECAKDFVKDLLKESEEEVV